MKESTSAASDPGAPEAAALAVRHLREHVEQARIDRLWFFPPLRQGRRETGLLAASLEIPRDGGGDGEAPETEDGGQARRLLVTVRYSAQETGKGTRFDPHLREEGEAPPDRIPRVIQGVLRRSDAAPGEPTEVPVSGDPTVLAELAGEDSGDHGRPGLDGVSAEGAPAGVDSESPPPEATEGRPT